MYRIILIFSLYLMSSCSTTDPNVDNQEIVLVDRINNDDWTLDSYIISDILVDGDNLNIIVNFSGGCKTHEFKLVVETAFEKTFPPRTHAILSHNSFNDNCEAYLTENLVFNLRPIKNIYMARYGNSGDLVIRIQSFGDVIISM